MGYFMYVNGAQIILALEKNLEAWVLASELDPTGGLRGMGSTVYKAPAVALMCPLRSVFQGIGAEPFTLVFL